MPEQPTITIPRLPDETPRAYAARVEYVTMGAGRSLARLSGRNEGGSRVTTRLATLERWSAQYGWVDSARQYDDAAAALRIQAAADAYRRDLEDHRQRYAKAGRDLYTVATAMVAHMARHLRDAGRTLELRDGTTYTVPAVRLSDTTLGAVSRALTIAGDLEAHALRLEELIPQLTDADDPR